MPREEIIRLIQSFNSSLDVQFLESLSQTQLSGYAQHLKAVRTKTVGWTEESPRTAGSGVMTIRA